MGLHYFDKIYVPNAPDRNVNHISCYASGVFAHEKSAERLTALMLGVPSRNPIRPRLEEALRVCGGAQAGSLPLRRCHSNSRGGVTLSSMFFIME